MKSKLIGPLMALLVLAALPLSACGLDRGFVSTGWAAEDRTQLPENITQVKELFVRGERAYLLCQEKDGGCYAASIGLDGGYFRKLSLSVKPTESLLAVALDGKDRIWALCQTGQRELSLRRYNSDGGLALDLSLAGLSQQSDLLDNASAFFLSIDSGQNLAVTVGSLGGCACFLFDQKGVFLFSLEAEGSPVDVAVTAEGAPAVCLSEDGGGNCRMLPVDLAAGAWGEAVPVGTVRAVYDGLAPDSFYLFDGSQLYRHRLAQGDREPLFIDLEALGLGYEDLHLYPLSGNSFAAVSASPDEGGALHYTYCVLKPATVSAEEYLAQEPAEADPEPAKEGGET